MYNVPINNRIIRKPILSTQQARLMSTNNVRKGGFSKLLLGTLFVSAAGIAYFQTSSRDKCEYLIIQVIVNLFSSFYVDRFL